jgi:hypothetical protein
LEEIYNRGGGANWPRYMCAHVRWGGQQITDAGAAALAEVLPGSQVTELDLSSNQITDAGAAALAQGLPGSQVTTLNLELNQITDAGAAALAEALPGSRITLLQLAGNQITDAGAAALAEALSGSQVEMLVLRRNQLTDAGAAALRWSGAALLATLPHLGRTHTPACAPAPDSTAGEPAGVPPVLNIDLTLEPC